MSPRYQKEKKTYFRSAVDSAVDTAVDSAVDSAADSARPDVDSATNGQTKKFNTFLCPTDESICYHYTSDVQRMTSETFWMWIFLWKEIRIHQLMSSPGAPSAGPSTPPNYSLGPSTPPSYSSGPSTPPNYSSRSSRNAECSNYKHLRGKISVLKATMNMHMHPEQHIVNSAALLHEVLNEMEKLYLE
nr:hypothetical protein [Tanacetum cinerariifolium]